MMPQRDISSALLEAGINFTGVGGDATATSLTLSWSGIPLNIRGLTDEQIEAAQAVLDAHPLKLDELRQAAAERIAAGYAAAVAGGFTPSGEEWSISASAQADITGIGLRVLIEQMQSTDTVKLPTSAGAITMTVANAQPIMVAFGQWLTPKREQLAQKTADASTASTAEAANAIEWVD